MDLRLKDLDCTTKKKEKEFQYLKKNNVFLEKEGRSVNNTKNNKRLITGNVRTYTTVVAPPKKRKKWLTSLIWICEEATKKKRKTNEIFFFLNISPSSLDRPVVPLKL